MSTVSCLQAFSVWIVSLCIIPSIFLTNYAYIDILALKFTKSECTLNWTKQLECDDWLCDSRITKCRIFATTKNDCTKPLIPLNGQTHYITNSNCYNIEKSFTKNDVFTCYINCNKQKYSLKPYKYIILQFFFNIFLLLLLPFYIINHCCCVNSRLFAWFIGIFVITISCFFGLFVEMLTDEDNIYLSSVNYNIKTQ